MLRTPLCDVLGIDAPIILAPMGSATSAEFAAAVSNQGGLGGIGTLFRTAAAIKRDIAERARVAAGRLDRPRVGDAALWPLRPARVLGASSRALDGVAVRGVAAGPVRNARRRRPRGTGSRCRARTPGTSRA
ncbi:MAG: nitronate monooxygenase [Candidatus Rokubacteria bacterium]|nr:nitronate monooxygenase [Candidatus Rokubacteria bacterium]